LPGKRCYGRYGPGTDTERGHIRVRVRVRRYGPGTDTERGHIRVRVRVRRYGPGTNTERGLSNLSHGSVV